MLKGRIDHSSIVHLQGVLIGSPCLTSIHSHKTC